MKDTQRSTARIARDLRRGELKMFLLLALALALTLGLLQTLLVLTIVGKAA